MEPWSTYGTWAGVALSFGVGVWGLFSARAANRHAKAAVDEARRANELAKQANDAARLSNPALDNPWSPVQRRVKSRFEVFNQTSRRVVVVRIEPVDERMSGLLDGGSDVVVDPGDTYSFLAVFTMAGGPDRICVHWRWADEDEVHVTHREVRE